MKKNLLFFSRSGLFYFFSDLKIPGAERYHAVININEKKEIEAAGEKVAGCFEEEFDTLVPADHSEISLVAGYPQDRFFGLFSLDKRNEIAGKLITFWKRILAEYKIDAVIHEIISCEFEETLSLVCKRMGVQDLTPVPSVVNNTFYFSESPYNSSFSAGLMSSLNPSPASIERAKAELKILMETGRYSPEVNWNLAHKKAPIRKAIAGFLKDVIRNGKKVVALHDDFRKRLFYYNDYIQHYNTTFDLFADELYKSVSDYDPIDFSKEIIFFPLQYEPEATLNYFSPLFDDQVSIIQTICKFMKPNQILVVKEHPGQPYALLSQKFQILKRKNSNLFYAPVGLKLEKVKESVSKVITITSTVGWEAVVFKIPTLVFGNVFFDSHPLATKFSSSLETLRSFITTDHIPGDSQLHYDATVDFLSRIIEYSYVGTALWDRLEPENKLLFAQAITKHINKDSVNIDASTVKQISETYI